MKRLVLAFMLLGVFPAGAEEEKPAIVPEKESAARTILTAPFAIPPLAVRTIGYPFKAFANFAQRTNFPLRALDFFSNDARTAYFYPAFKFGDNAGLWLGAGALHRNLFNRKYQGNFLALVGLGLDQEMYLSLSTPSFSPLQMSTGTNNSWRLKKSEPFYGVGNDTPKDEVRYRFENLNAGIPISGRFMRVFRLSALGQFVYLKTLNADRGSPVLGDVFSSAEAPGFNDSIFAGEFGGRLALNTTTQGGTPGKGTKASVELSRFQGESPYRFFRWKASASQFFTPFKKGRVFGVGFQLESVHTLDGDEVPFPLLPTLGGSTKLRGFARNRFRDNTSILLVGEYRYPIWWMADGTLFVEGGRVGTGLDDLNPKGLKPSGGFAFRFRTSEVFFFKIQVAASDEGMRFGVAFNQTL